jgi:hypothetical protein
VQGPLPNVLPFHKLKSLAWSEFQVTTDGSCLVATIENNPRLEELSVSQDVPFTDGFLQALFLHRHTLTYIQFHNKMMTDHDLIAIGQHCTRLTSIDISTGWGLNPVSYVTDIGIFALAQGCGLLETIRTDFIPLSAASLTELFDRCPHLKEVYCPAAEVNEDAVHALCGPTRMAAIEDFTCCWAVMAGLDTAFFEQAFSGMRKFWVYRVAEPFVRSLCDALRVMPQLQELILSPSQDTRLPVSVLDSLAHGAATGLQDMHVSMYIVGNAEDSLVTLARRNPNLKSLVLNFVADGITDAVLYAVAENCQQLWELGVRCGAKHVTDASVIALAQGCPHLTRLALQTCSCLTDRSIMALADHCPRLCSLDVRDSPLITEVALTHLLKSCPWMFMLEVSDVGINAQVARRLQCESGAKQMRVTRVQASVLVWVAAMAASVWRTLIAWWRALVARWCGAA